METAEIPSRLTLQGSSYAASATSAAVLPGEQLVGLYGASRAAPLLAFRRLFDEQCL
jgi:hypothetical protein